MQRTLSKGWVGNSRASLNRSTNKKVNNLMDKSLYKDVSETLPVPSGKWYDPRKTTIQYYQNNLDERLAKPKRLNSKFNTNYESRKIPVKKQMYVSPKLMLKSRKYSAVSRNPEE